MEGEWRIQSGFESMQNHRSLWSMYGPDQAPLVPQVQRNPLGVEQVEVLQMKVPAQ